jgi:hypothetical protein
MNKILSAIAGLALTALGTSIIGTVLLHTSISHQAGQLGALQRAEHSDHQKIAALESGVGAARKHKRLTATYLPCTRLPPLPVRQPGVALVAAYSLLPVRHAC